MDSEDTSVQAVIMENETSASLSQLTRLTHGFAVNRVRSLILEKAVLGDDHAELS